MFGSRLPELEAKLRRGESELWELRRLVGLARQQGQSVLLSGFTCSIEFDFTVTDSSSGSPLAGALVTLLSSGGVIVATGTSDGSGLVTLTASFADTFSWTATASGYTSASGSLSGSCGDTQAVPVAMSVPVVLFNYGFFGHVRRGGSALLGAVVHLTIGGFTFTDTTHFDGSGTDVIYLINVSFPASSSYDIYATYSGSTSSHHTGTTPGFSSGITNDFTV